MIPPSKSLKSALLFLLAILSGVLAAAAARRPNILWIFSEDLSPYMGCYGDPINTGHTPSIDALASQGVLFKHAYMPAPVCSPCRSAMITGVMQTTTGTHQHRSSRAPEGKIDPKTFIKLPAGMKTIPELMRGAGYFTFNSGKDDYNFYYDRRKLYSVGTKKNYKPGMNGWQGNFARHSGSFTEDTWRARPDRDQPWFGQIMLWGGKAGNRHVRKGEKLAATDVPIPPYFPDTPAHRKSWTIHYNAVRGADARVQKILDLLKADGELENTVVFFFSDHGNNQSLRHKQFCYEGGVLVPLMIKGPLPALKPGTVRNDLVSGLDISATTLAMGGAKLPGYLDGHDLFAPDFTPRKFVISARDRCDYTIDRIRTVRTGKLDLKRLHKEGKLTPYQEKFWFGVRPKEELYDIAKDPFQMHNLAGDPAFAKELERHRKILEDWIRETGDKGQFPEDPVQLKATYDLWKTRPIFRNAKVNPEYDQFRK